MYEGELEKEVDVAIARHIDYVRDKLLEKGHFEAVQNECRKMIELMSTFPEVRSYRWFLSGLRDLTEQKVTERNATFTFDIVRRFFDVIFSACTTKPAQRK